MMKITFRDQHWDIKPGITARDAIIKVGLDPESVLIVINGKVVTDDVILRETDDVKLVAVISGGACHASSEAACCPLRPALHGRFDGVRGYR